MLPRVWDLAAGEALASLEGHTDAVWAVAVTPDGARAVSGSYDHTPRVWDLASLREASYTNAKVLLVGETGVGKTGLAHRLTTGTPPGRLLSTDAAWATHWPLPHEPEPSTASGRSGSGTSPASPTTGSLTRCTWTRRPSRCSSSTRRTATRSPGWPSGTG